MGLPLKQKIFVSEDEKATWNWGKQLTGLMLLQFYPCKTWKELQILEVRRNGFETEVAGRIPNCYQYSSVCLFR